jgi:hypothetical protein
MKKRIGNIISAALTISLAMVLFLSMPLMAFADSATAGDQPEADGFPWWIIIAAVMILSAIVGGLLISRKPWK